MIFIFYKSCMENNSKSKSFMECTCGNCKKTWNIEQINSGDRREIFDEIEISSVMEKFMENISKNYSYAADISWHTIMKSICTLYEVC